MVVARDGIIEKFIRQHADNFEGSVYGYRRSRLRFKTASVRPLGWSSWLLWLSSVTRMVSWISDGGGDCVWVSI